MCAVPMFYMAKFVVVERISKTKTGLVSRMHIHNNVEVIKVTEGEIRLDFEDNSVMISAGDVICINSRIQHSLFITTENTEYYYIQFKKTKILDDEKAINSPFFEEFIVDTKNPFSLIEKDSEINKQVTFYMMQMYERTKMDSEYNDYFLNHFLNIIKGILFENKFLNSIEIEHIGWQKICKVVEYIDSYYERNITLDEISQCVHHNKHYICHLFKSITNQSIFDYLTYVRVAEGEYLLKNSNLKISDVAAKVGFSTQVGFDKAFKKMNNCTPKQYRKKWYKKELFKKVN